MIYYNGVLHHFSDLFFDQVTVAYVAHFKVDDIFSKINIVVHSVNKVYDMNDFKEDFYAKRIFNLNCKERTCEEILVEL